MAWYYLKSISFLHSLFFPGSRQIELLNVAWMLQEPGHVGSKECTRSQVKIDYFMIPYTSIFIRLSHFYQECYVHFIVITNDGEMALIRGWLIKIRM